MTDTEFSIVIPVYNVEKYLGKCVDSVLSQDFADFELILVDDGSPDNCGAVCDKYALSDNRVKVVHKANGGLISAWKAGVRTASRKYLMFVDGDDWIERGLLSEMARLLNREKADMVQFGFRGAVGTCGSGAKSVTVNSLDTYPHLMYYNGYDKIISNNRVNKVFLTERLRSLLDDIDNRVEIGEDKQTTFCYVLNSDRIILSNYGGYNYRRNYHSMTNVYLPDTYEKTCVLFDRMETAAKKYSVYDFSEQAKKEKVIFAVGIMANAFRCNDKKQRRVTFDKIINDAQIREGAFLIDTQGLNPLCRAVVRGIKRKNFEDIAFWFWLKKIKNKIDAVKNRFLKREIR